jgi:hypothetical protein
MQSGLHAIARFPDRRTFLDQNFQIAISVWTQSSWQVPLNA